MAYRPLMPRLEAKSVRVGSCVEWRGHRMTNGYGTISWRGEPWLVHRAAWTHVNGTIPDGLTIDHLCRNRACVNVEHMEVVTRTENSRRGGGLEAAHEHYRNQTHCKSGHEFTPDNVRLRKSDGARICKECSRANWRAYRARRGVIPDHRRGRKKAAATPTSTGLYHPVKEAS